MDDATARRFWPKVDRRGPDECWPWQGAGATIGQGYGKFLINGKMSPAHRVAYEALVGPIPPGLHLDHLCRVPRCVNPAHLEPVTPAENTRRGDAGAHWAKATHCRKGHPLTEENVYRRDGNRRACRTCKRLAMRRLRARRYGTTDAQEGEAA